MHLMANAVLEPNHGADLVKLWTLSTGPCVEGMMAYRQCCNFCLNQAMRILKCSSDTRFSRPWDFSGRTLIGSIHKRLSDVCVSVVSVWL